MGSPPNERALRQDIVEVCRRIYAHGWLASSDGNVSVRLSRANQPTPTQTVSRGASDRFLATPTGIHKGYLSEDDLIIVDQQGRKIEGTREPSSELRMHLAAYRERPDVHAVVHAHPTNCIAFSLAGVTLAQCLLPEVVFTLGSIPTVAYSTPGTDEVPTAIREWVREFDAMVLDRHGSLTLGRDVYDAYNKLERMEHVAEITYRARMLGPIQPLTCEQVTRLQTVGQGLGLPARKLLESPCDNCNACEAGRAGANEGAGRASANEGAGRAGDAAPNASGEQKTDEMVRRVSESIGRELLVGKDRG